MSTFLTPPVWYDEYGTLNDMLKGKSVEEGNLVIGSSASCDVNVFNSTVVYGSAASAGNNPVSNVIAIGIGSSVSQTGAIAVGSGASGSAEGVVSIGYAAQAKNTGGIAIGRNAEVEASGSIAIGDGASVSSENTIQLGKNNAAYTLNVGNGYVSIGKFSISPITSGDYANQVILGNINQIKAPTDGISFEVAARRNVGTIIYPTKVQTLTVDATTINATTCNVKKNSVTSTSGSATLSANCLYVINFGSIRAMLHTTTNNSNTHQFIYSLNSTTDYVMYVNNVLSGTTSVTCKIQQYNKNGNTYTDYTNGDFTAIKVCSFTDS